MCPCRSDSRRGGNLAGASTGAPVKAPREEGLRHDVLFNYDLRLPENFTPINGDGEVDEFMLWPISKVVHEVGREGVFKFNSALVVIDYLVRHGFISPEIPGYTEIVSGLHREI